MQQRQLDSRAWGLMYENLEQIATLKFGKEMESISSQTREKVKEMQNEYAALIGSSGVRSGQHEAAVGRAQDRWS